jgi:hypothetical protein
MKRSQGIPIYLKEGSSVGAFQGKINFFDPLAAGKSIFRVAHQTSPHGSDWGFLYRTLTCGNSRKEEQWL